MASKGFIHDAWEAFQLILNSSWERLLHSWIYVPLGMIIVMLACLGIDSLIGLSSVAFPASVACMIILFLGLLGLNVLLGDRKTRQVVKLLDVPCEFALRHINILLTPSFILIPLSSPIGGVEIAKIVGVFAIGYLAMFAFTAYFVRALLQVFGSSKRALAERAEEVGTEQDSIPLTNAVPTSESSTPAVQSELNSTIELHSELQAPSPAQNPSEVIGSGGPPETDINTEASTTILRHDPVPLTKPQKWAALVGGYLDTFIYATLMIFLGIPLYFAPETNYAMPVQLGITVLAYFGALALPSNWKRFFHPVLVTALIALIAIWIIGLAHGNSLTDALDQFSTGTKYYQLFRGEDVPPPGAGDFLGGVLDVSIVALAMPMFQYRKELKRNFVSIILPNVMIAIGSVFGYPSLCAALGISSKRSISFVSRSLTLALATPATANFGGDQSLAAILVIASGMLGALFGSVLLRWLRIREDDYITRGVTLGSNSSAIATALLLTSDPRAAAFSSLSMGLFGTVTVAISSVPPVVGIVQQLAGAKE